MKLMHLIRGFARSMMDFNSGGSAFYIGSEMDLEVNVVDDCEGNVTDASLQKMAILNEAEPVSSTPATPSRFGR